MPSYRLVFAFGGSIRSSGAAPPPPNPHAVDKGPLCKADKRQVLSIAEDQVAVDCRLQVRAVAMESQTREKFLSNSY